jgi:hypothetical protein
MKKFARHKTLGEIRSQCMLQRLELNDRLYETEGYDTVKITGGGAWVIYNTFNGRFFGATPKGIEFTSDSPQHDSKPWMQALLSFFYVEKGA